MSPNDTTDSEDFVLVDRSAINPALRDVLNPSDTANSPVECDYDKIDFDDSENSPVKSKATEPEQSDVSQPMLHFDCFAPMPSSGFPHDLILHVGSVDDNGLMRDDKGHGSSSLGTPPKTLIAYATLLFECALHFKDIHSRIAQDHFFYMIGQVCASGLRTADAKFLTDYVGYTLDTFHMAREAFLLKNAGKSSFTLERTAAEELAKLVDQYIANVNAGPQERMEDWGRDPLFKSLWFQWEDKLQDTASRRSLRQLIGSSKVKETSFQRCLS